MSEATETKQQWRQRLVDYGQKNGFFRELGPQHDALFVRRGKVLVVTFDNLDHVYNNAEDRMPWGFGFVESRGWSVLGLMASGWTWYRDDHVFAFFDELRDTGFFDQFERVVFYGASMGGYGACAFSAACPGAHVVAIAPQSTLSRDIAPWEPRYRKVWWRDFNGPYGYAPDMVKTAASVRIFYDPRTAPDAMHAVLFRGPNVERIQCRSMTHWMASMWASMGVLKPIVEGSILGTLPRAEIYKLLRARRGNFRYEKEILAKLQAARRHDLLLPFCRWVLARRKGPHFRNALIQAIAVQKQRGRYTPRPGDPV